MLKKSINIIGAFDRYNYGDLLFPIIIEKYLERYSSPILEEYDLEYYGLVESDLSKVGGKKTKPLKDLYNNPIEKHSLIIVSGGEVLAARISSMDVDLSPNNFTTIIKKIIIKLIGRRNFEKFSMKRFFLNTRFPWVVDKRNFSTNIYVAYNAVGGSILNTLIAKELSQIKDALKTSDYISVRDEKSLQNIEELKPSLAPDSAIIMSEFFQVEVLETKISKTVKEAVSSCSNGYICIQTNLCSVRSKELELVDQVERIAKDTGLKVVLLPIGIAANHDDVIALKNLIKLFKIDVIYIEDINIYDIMYFIAKSSFFAGTSLHGIITSMSYAIPHIGLNKDIPKLDNYLKTWGVSGQDHCIDFNELYESYNNIKDIPKQKLIENKDEMIALSLKNFDSLFMCLDK
ncbi:polysaccharide pyruvyl transferase family protein [Clostridium algidicarnis]|uniref:polysaccharide pyruvyl transferase family protein n=1 Tax=Clostridium algidicarnis TaxID=37659 RepID=UPI001629793C|nr:polysaccharide pyruvyl transferase family protein [Clostridium algidicarnis]MBB6631505.1 polysaccharide pyruvyl transferase family protein [Clostridium algidicarnis]